MFRLNKKIPNIPDYPIVADVLKNKYGNLPIISGIRGAVVEIRVEKLPDPNLIPNAGSFFKNVFVAETKFAELKEEFPDMPSFISGDLYKIPTGWLVEKAGYKGCKKRGVGVYEKNALILVNYSAKSLKEILDLAREIQSAVMNKFGVQIGIEPEIVS